MKVVQYVQLVPSAKMMVLASDEGSRRATKRILAQGVSKWQVAHELSEVEENG